MAGQPQTNMMPVLPFVAAAHEHTEPMFDTSFVPGANAVNIGPYDVPAFGFLRHLTLFIEFSGGVLGAGVFHPDAPFNVLTDIQLADVNGGPIFGPMPGYETFLTNLFGGYDFVSDPRLDPIYASGINAAFILRIPVEISHHDGFGSIANQNAAASYKLTMRGNNATGATGLFTTAPTTVPTVRVRGYLEAWTAPSAQDPAGRPQAVLPPRHGTTQYWSYTVKDASAGAVQIQASRVGYIIRNLIVVVRDTTANVKRVTDANLPDPVELVWDQRSLFYEPVHVNRSRLARSQTRYSDIPAGILGWQWDRLASGHSGDGGPGLWIPTVQSTRLEIKTSALPASAKIYILTNDVAPVEVSPNERYVQTSDTGFTPAAFVGGAA